MGCFNCNVKTSNKNSSISTLPDLGVGVDIVDINHFRHLNLKDNKHLLEKIFTQKELDYCFSKVNPAQHLAVRYSGKESVVKALSSLGFESPYYSHIEITNEVNGVPQVNIESNQFAKLQIQLSLSHCDDKAVSFVFAIKNQHERE